MFVVLPFLECHAVVIQYVAFPDWLLSLSNMHLSFLHVSSWLDSSFLFSVEVGCNLISTHASCLECF